MKRRAQLGGIRVGIFEEAHDRDDVIRFLKRVNQTLLKLDGDPNDPIHLKAFDKAGCLGHRVIRTPDEVDTIPDEEFPVLMESHLDGWEFAVEAWIHDGEICFLNISEYVTLGYSVFVPASPELEAWRPRIREEIEKLIKTFDLKSGFIHPEYFVTSDGTMYFGKWPSGRRASRCSSCWSGSTASTPTRAWCWCSTRKPRRRKSRPSSPRGGGRGRPCRLLRRLPAPAGGEPPGDPRGDPGRPLLRFPRADPAPGRNRHQAHRLRHPLGPGVFPRRRPYRMRDLLKHQEDLDFYI